MKNKKNLVKKIRKRNLNKNGEKENSKERKETS